MLGEVVMSEKSNRGRGVVPMALLTALSLVGACSAGSSGEARPTAHQSTKAIAQFKDLIKKYTEANGGKSINMFMPNSDAVVWDATRNELSVSFSSAALQTAENYKVYCDVGPGGVIPGIDVIRESIHPSLNTSYLNTANNVINRFCPDLSDFGGDKDPFLTKLGELSFAQPPVNSN